MAKIIALHQSDALTLPLAGGAALRATPFRETARIALTLFGPGGGNAGGVILGASRARLLGSWLLRLADEAGADSPGGRPAPCDGSCAEPRVRRPAAPRRVTGPARSADRRDPSRSTPLRPTPAPG